MLFFRALSLFGVLSLIHELSDDVVARLLASSASLPVFCSSGVSFVFTRLSFLSFLSLSSLSSLPPSRLLIALNAVNTVLPDCEKKDVALEPECGVTSNFVSCLASGLASALSLELSAFTLSLELDRTMVSEAGSTSQLDGVLGHSKRNGNYLPCPCPGMRSA